MINYRILYNKYKQLKRNFFLNTKWKNVIKIGKGTVFRENVKFDFRVPHNRLSVSIGRNSIIDASFIFESTKGFIQIGERVYIGSGTNLISRNKIIIGNDTIIGWGVYIYDHNSHSLNWKDRLYETNSMCYAKKTSTRTILKRWNNVVDKPIIIGNSVWIGMQVLILKGVTIGNGAVIGARSVITKDVPPFSVVAGNPAKIVKRLNK